MTEEETLAVLRPRLTPMFLTTLVQAVRTAGWSQDFHETALFVQWCYSQAGYPEPDHNVLEPYSNTYPDTWHGAARQEGEDGPRDV